MSRSNEFDSTTISVFAGNANPLLAQEITRHLHVPLGPRARRALQRRRGQRRIDGERARPRCVHRAAHVSARERQFDGIADDDRCLPPGIGEAHHRGGALFRLRAPGPPAARDARGDRRQAGGEHDRARGRRSAADGGSARGPDPGIFRHSGRQRVCLAGAARAMRGSTRRRT